MNLDEYIAKKKKGNKILLMTHQIIGYPDFDTNEKAMDCFSQNGVDIVELQIPFSDPSADGPTFVKANQKALDNGVKVKDCFNFIEKMIKKHDMAFIIMTYFNILYQYGIKEFIDKSKEIGVKGLIVPDAPIDEAKDYYEYSKEKGVSPICLATPYVNDERIKEISKIGSGFIYYVPRKGVTGYRTSFDEDVIKGIKRVKEISKQNIAVGFGIQKKEDIEDLIGSSDIAIIGSQIQRVIEEDGISGLDKFIKIMFSAKK